MKKLMIVDDETSNLELFSEIFEDEENLEVLCCASGEDALNQFQSFQPDVVILDIMMPGKDGFTVCEEIKKTADPNSTKIIMVTGMAGIEVEEKATQSGCDRFYLKPVRISLLKDEVLAVI